MWKGESQCESCGCGEKGADGGPFSTYLNYTKGYRVIWDLLVRGYVTWTGLWDSGMFLRVGYF